MFAVEIAGSEVVESLDVIGKETGTEMSLAGCTDAAREEHLPADDIKLPVLLPFVQEVDAQSGDNLPSVAVVLPVDGKWIEMLAVEIHHGEENVHDAFTQPRLCVLMNGITRIPAVTALLGKVGVFAYRRAAELDPGTYFLDGLVYFPDDAGYVCASPFVLVLSFPVFPERAGVIEGNALFRIADIIEVDAVNRIVADDFLTDAGNVVACFRHSGVHHPLVTATLAHFRMSAGQSLLAQCAGGPGFAYGECDDPCVQFHSSFVAFLNGKFQWVVEGGLSGCTGENFVPWLNGRGVGCCGADACLKQYRIDAGLLQLVKDGAQFLLLVFCPRRALCRLAGPVETAESSEPHGANFFPWRAEALVEREKGLCACRHGGKSGKKDGIYSFSHGS